ncbi:site-2 protease family protein [Deinococcus lacus]|uniref:Site-2 protease family protein n=1 Tax=Deinococcus lacus TaxID=392561 RepID=A0ABW1Y9P1_9DEIO
MGLSLLLNNPLAFLLIAAALLLSITVHEFAHAIVADRLGDSTPRRQGRVTLNPASHLDPIGTLMLLLVGFGFGRPVMTNPAALSRWGSLWVAAAGPLSNLLIAVVTGLLMNVVNAPLGDVVLQAVFSVNMMLAVLNLLPIPGLDGSRILGALVPSLGRALQDFERNPMNNIIVLVFLIAMLGPIGNLIGRVSNVMLRALSF